MRNERYSEEQVEALRSKLREAPAKASKSYSKREVISLLREEIKELQKRGYTLESIAEMIRGEGIGISTATLRLYMQKSAPAKSGRDKKKSEDTPRRAAAAIKGAADVAASKATFTPKPDSDDI